MSIHKQNELNTFDEAIQANCSTFSNEEEYFVTKGHQLGIKEVNNTIEIKHQSLISMSVKIPQMKRTEAPTNVQMLKKALTQSYNTLKTQKKYCHKLLCVRPKNDFRLQILKRIFLGTLVLGHTNAAVDSVYVLLYEISRYYRIPLTNNKTYSKAIMQLLQEC